VEPSAPPSSRAIPARAAATALLDDPARLAAALTLAALLLAPIGFWLVRPLVLVLALAGLLLPGLAARAPFWLGLATLSALRVAMDWPLSDNHAYLVPAWCLALALSPPASDAPGRLALSARSLIFVVFALAVVQKLLVSPDYLDGTFFRVTLLGDPRFETSSIQSKMQNYHREAVVLRKRSRAAGRPWVIFGDEQSTAQDGVLPDEEDPDHDIPRIEALWGNLIGGGAGVEWYFGYEHPHNDLNCEDWRSRDAMWDQTRYALDFFQRYLPFWEMSPADALANPPARPEAEEDGGEKEEDSEETSGGSGQPDEAAETDGEEASEEQSPKRVRVLAKVPEIYAVQLPEGGEASLTVGSGRYRVEWYDPRNGGDLQQGEVQWITGPGTKTLGPPPSDPDLDWMALVRRSQ